MKVSKKEWDSYISKLSKINKKASDLIVAYVNEHGLDDIQDLVSYANKVVMKYGSASASLNALMYDTITELEGMFLPAAELAALPEYGDVAKSIYGTLKTSQNSEEIGGAVGRLVKQTGQDTMLQNAMRDHAEYAWIPVGETCAFCLTLAANGWQPISASALKGGHAEHIHANCDCSYMIRHSKDLEVSGYQPEKYQRMYYDAEGRSAKAKINSMRREFYAENREEILEQKASAYEKRKELNSSAAEETEA